MRVLSQTECKEISGSYFIEGLIFDDAFVCCAALGCASAIGYNLVASYYPERTDLHVNSIKDIVTSTLYTGLLGAKYGALGDIIFGAGRLMNSVMF